MSTRIRAATAADIPAITAIYAHAVRFGTASFEIDPPDAAEMGERFAVLAAGGFPYLVAATDTGIAGYAYAGPYRTRVAYRNTVEDSVYLDPQFHRRGIGRALLDRLVKRIRSARLPANGRRDRRFRASRLDRAASRRGFPDGRNARSRRPQVRPLDRHRPHAASPRPRRDDPAVTVSSPPGKATGRWRAVRGRVRARAARSVRSRK